MPSLLADGFPQNAASQHPRLVLGLETFDQYHRLSLNPSNMCHYVPPRHPFHPLQGTHLHHLRHLSLCQYGENHHHGWPKSSTLAPWLGQPDPRGSEEYPMRGLWGGYQWAMMLPQMSLTWLLRLKRSWRPMASWSHYGHGFVFLMDVFHIYNLVMNDSSVPISKIWIDQLPQLSTCL